MARTLVIGFDLHLVLPGRGSAPPGPGAVESLAAVRDAGGQILVGSATDPAHARLLLEQHGLAVDAVVGDLFSDVTGKVLDADTVAVHVGGHVDDVAGAREAGVLSVGVATGPCSAAELRLVGADVVLDDLTWFPTWFEGYLLDSALGALEDRLRAAGSILVAFSGGADSAFLLAAAARTLGTHRVVAATASSDSLPAAELAAAGVFCGQVGVRHVTPQTHELQRAGYRANGGDRCYFCKAELVEALAPLAAGLGLEHVATGTNADDIVAGFRPGIRAAAERGAITPLLDAGLRKRQIRAASRRWGLPTWDKPAAACLSSRIAYGIEVTSGRLARVERAELAATALLTAAGVDVVNLRVRDLGDVARIEVDPRVVVVLGSDPDLAATVVGAVRNEGFAAATVDADGFRSGAMNELLAEPGRYR